MILRLRTKLIASFLLVIMTCGVISTVIGVRLVETGIVKQAQDKVRLDLNSARLIYTQAVADVREVVRHTAVRFFLRDALSENDMEKAASELRRVMKDESLDLLNLTDLKGNILYRTGNPSVKGDSQAHREVLRTVMSTGQIVVSTEIVGREDLVRDGQDLADRAYMRLIDTPRAKSTDKNEETSGMMIVAASPLFDAEGKILAFLYGGKLVNQNYDLVDKIKETVYKEARYGGKDVGTATIFQGDLRISTNVMTKEGRRAIGTRVSEKVYQRVLVQGQPWIERAFVVNEWYITAYEPIRSISGQIVGILYVGMLEKEFADMKRNALLMFLGITAGGVILSIIICLFLTRTLVHPLNNLVLAAHSLASGDLEQHVPLDESTMEIAFLGQAFNTMASSIKERDGQLRRRAQEEISKSERLALIGRLAAGVAHEINNPLGGILLLSSILLKKAPTEGKERENLERIAKEAERAKGIVQGLLDFARQREPEIQATNIHDVINRTLGLFENQTLFQNINIVRDFADDLPAAQADPSQIQQVFANIIVNAAEAMKGRGTLTVATRTRSSDEVEISFHDTGEGISDEVLPHLFEPFFTTKEAGKGTGLGLSISCGIVEKHAGSMSVSSTIGSGTEFVVNLPSVKGKG